MLLALPACHQASRGQGRADVRQRSRAAGVVVIDRQVIAHTERDSSKMDFFVDHVIPHGYFRADETASNSSTAAGSISNATTRINQRTTSCSPARTSVARYRTGQTLIASSGGRAVVPTPPPPRTQHCC